MPIACLAAIVGGASAASACPSCQAALAEGQGDLARGIYYSILFMMSMPFAIVGTFSVVIYRAVKREQRRKEAEAAQQQSREDES
jgi:hypothetical protein